MIGLTAAVRRIGCDIPSDAEVTAAHCTAHDDHKPGEPAFS